MTMTVKARPAVTPVPTVDLVQDDPTVRGRGWLLVALGVALIPLLAAAAWWYLAVGPGAYTSVPPGLLGGDLAAAEALLDEAGLDVVTVEEFHPTQPAGEVIAITPVEGDEIRKGETVTVVVSKGPDLRQVTVTGVGQPLEETEAALTEAGFVVTTVHAYSDTVPAGVVITMADKAGKPLVAGDRLPVGTTVVLTVSDGRQPVTVPTVVGMAQADAVAALTAAGLQVTHTQAYSSDVPAGVVKAQDPAGSAAVFRLDTVAIVVSLGAEPPPPPPAPVGVVIPKSVIGMTKFPALDLLAGKGFDARYERHTCTVDWAQCVVAYTVPAAGTSQTKGSKVTIWLTNPAGVEAANAVIPAGVVGMFKHPALDLLAQNGFGTDYNKGTCTKEWSECIVEYTVPAAGSSLPKGTTVTIYLRD